MLQQAGRRNVFDLVRRIPQTLGELGELSGKEEVADLMVTAGALPQLQHIIASPTSSTDAVLRAALILKNLAKYDPLVDADDSRADAVFSSNILPSLVELLAHKSASVAANAAQALANIALANDTRSDAVVALGAVPKLLALMESSKEDVLQSAVLAVGNICSGTDEHRIVVRASQLQKHGAVMRLAKLLHCKNTEVRIAATRALRLLIAHSEDTLRAHAGELMPGLLNNISKINSHSESDTLLKVELLTLLIALLRADGSTAVAFLALGGLAIVLKILSSKHTPVKLVTACTATMGILVTERAHLTHLISSHKALPKLFALLLHPSDTVRQEILAFLVVISELGDDIKLQMLRAGCIASLVRVLLQPGARETNILHCLSLLDLLTLPRLHETSAVDFCRIIKDSMLSPVLFNLLESESPQIVQQSVCVLRNVYCVATAEVRAMFVDEDGIAFLLSAIAQETDIEMLQPCLETLAYLCDPLPDESPAYMEPIHAAVITQILPHLPTLLDTDKLAAACCWIVESVVKDAEHHADAIATPDNLAAIVNLLATDDEDVVHAALGALIALCIDSSPRRRAIYDLAGGPKVALLLASPSDRCRVAAAECLVLLCTGGESAAGLREKLLEKNIIPSLAVPLTRASDDMLPHVAMFFWVLIQEGGEFQKAAIAAGAIPLLTRFLSVSNNMANWRAAKALASLLEDYSCLYGMVAAGAVPLIVLLLDSHNEDCQRAALECITRLTFSNHIEMAEEAGVVPRLIAMLGRPLEIRAEVIVALAAVRGVRNAKSINAALLAAMHSTENTQICRIAAENLMSCDPGLVPLSLVAAAAKKLVKLLQSSPSDARIVARSIAQCVDSSDKGDAFVEAGLLPLIPNLLRSTDSFVSVWATIITRNLAVDSDARTAALVEAGVGPCLLALLGSSDLHCRLAGLFSISSLVCNGAHINTVLGDPTAALRVLALLDEPIDELLLGACQVLQYAAHNEDARQQLMRQNCVGQLVKLFHSVNVSVVCEASLTLAALAAAHSTTSNASSKHAHQIVEEGAVPALLAALRSRKSKKLTSSTAFALSALTERSFLASNALVDSGALSVLDSMMDSGSHGMQEVGVDVLGTLFQNQDAEKRATALMARNSMKKVLGLLDSSSPEVRQVVALTMWHASKTDAGGHGLLGSHEYFLRLCKKHLRDESSTRTALLQSFANIVRLCPADARGVLRDGGVDLVDMASQLLPILNSEANSDLQLMIDCTTILACLREPVDGRCSTPLLETLLMLLLRVADIADHTDDFLAWALVQPIALLSAADANKEPLYNEGFVAPLARLLDMNSDRTAALILKTFANLGFYGDVTLLVPGLTERLAAMTGPSQMVADAAIVMFQSLQPTVVAPSVVKAPPAAAAAAAAVAANPRRSVSMGQPRILLCCMEDQQSIALWLRDRLQQLGFTAMSPDLRQLTPASLQNLHGVIDQATAVVVCVDAAMVSSEVHRAFVGICLLQKKQVIPVKLQSSFRLVGWLTKLAADDASVLCFEQERQRALSLDGLVQVLQGKPLSSNLVRRSSLVAH